MAARIIAILPLRSGATALRRLRFLVAFGGFPADEVDDDLDCFVECTGFDATQWEGGAHSCTYRDLNSAFVSENTVIGGDDCNDFC